MKKISILVLSTIAIITLLASCNLDSTDGIGTLVRNDQYEESFRTSHVIGVGSDTIYVKTDKGIRRYAKNDDGTKYTFHDDSYYGNSFSIENPKGAICMDNDTVLYECSDGYFKLYYTETQTFSDEIEIKSTTDSIKMKFVLDSYSTDGKYFTIIFQGENGDTYLATLDLSSTTVAGITSSSFTFKDITSINEAYRDNITIVGKDAIKYSTTHGTSTGESQYYYTTDITAGTMTFHTMSNSTYQKKFIIGAININGSSDSRFAIDLNGRLYANETYLKQPLSSTIVTKLPIVSDGTRTLCIYSGRVIYAEGTGTDFNSKTASNLSSTMVPIMIKRSTSDTNLYLVFTELSGAYVYNFSDNTMTSLAKKNTSYSLSDFI